MKSIKDCNCIINNFENLYSIGSIEKEMREAVEYFNYNGESENIKVHVKNTAITVLDYLRGQRRDTYIF